MKAIIAITATDTVGIIAAVSTYLAQCNVNILDISQTIMQDHFVMIMLVDYQKSKVPFDTLRSGLLQLGQEQALSIHVQREDIFNAMHRI